MDTISPKATNNRGMDTAQVSIRLTMYCPPLVAVGRARRNIRKHTHAENNGGSCRRELALVNIGM